MYTVHRKDGRILITDWTGNTVYTADTEAWLVYHHELLGLKAEKIGGMADPELLLALAKAQKLAL